MQKNWRKVNISITLKTIIKPQGKKLKEEKNRELQKQKQVTKWQKVHTYQ